MRTVWSWTVCALLAAGLVAACSSDPVRPGAELEGAWEWIRSEGGLLPDVRTPETEGYTLTWVLDAAGRARLFRDGRLSGETTWERTVGGPEGALEGVPVIRFGEPLLGFAEQSYRLEDSDRLILADGCCDGFTRFFERRDP